ncbi:metallophosphoesterase [Tamlana fucoidanivorans]|uniref:Calcineurin-like phosphoesterase domain-containing protein n=1 Tax=Allotamlana fucoidanivorans TaxID=2583814 RepID=A0A5C4SNM6_9FLAO|nr:metallophosphoesterase [Tamlana fucoidanivorans]TNJ44914.1 hypothetical protein FGF67_07050 [Tamlana fucoidanivorans]
MRRLPVSIFMLWFLSCHQIKQESFNFVQLCDIQLGMGGYAHDKKTFEQAVKQINLLKPDFAIVCGDLVNNATDSSYADFKTIVNKFRIPYYLAAGNHDVGNVPDKKSLTYYRNRIGKDYYKFKNKKSTFVVVNTQLWNVEVQSESEQHHIWFKNTLDSLEKTKENIFVVGHYPLYIKSPNESDEYFNIPIQKREEILNLLVKNKVKAYLSGHKHETIINTYKNIQLVTGETTCKNFDNRPLGFRFWTVSQDSISHKFIRLIGF